MFCFFFSPKAVCGPARSLPFPHLVLLAGKGSGRAAKKVSIFAFLRFPFYIRKWWYGITHFTESFIILGILDNPKGLTNANFVKLTK